MGGKSWWVLLIQWTIWVILMLAIMGLIARSRARPRAASETDRLVYPANVRLLGFLGFALFAGLILASNLVPSATTSLWVTAVFAGFALGFAALIFLSFHEHRATDDGLAYTSLTGKGDFFRWSELTAIRYSAAMKWFSLETGAGKKARLSVALMGLPECARLLLERAQPAAIDAETVDVLRATAAGHPPSLWT